MSPIGGDRGKCNMYISKQYVYLSYTEGDGSDACKDATDALAIYGAMDDCRGKSKFLNRFISEGREKGNGPPKFMYSYQRIATRAKEDETSSTSLDMNRHAP